MERRGAISRSLFFLCGLIATVGQEMGPLYRKGK